MEQYDEMEHVQRKRNEIRIVSPCVHRRNLSYFLAHASLVFHIVNKRVAYYDNGIDQFQKNFIDVINQNKCEEGRR